MRLKIPSFRAQAQGRLRVRAHLLRPRPQVLLHEVAVEGLVARGHGGVGGEDGVERALRDPFREPVAAAHLLPRALQAEEGHVPLVHVPDRGVDAEGAQRAHPAHAQHDLLAQAHLAAAHVEDAGDGAVRGVVEGDVGVEHQHRHLADLGLPHRGLHHAAGQVDGHGEHAAARAPPRAGRAAARSRSRDRCAAGSRPRPRSGGSSPSGTAGRRRPGARRGRWPPCSGRRPGCRGRPSTRPAIRGCRTPSRSTPMGPGTAPSVLVEPARARAVGVEGVDHALVGAAELGVAEQAVPVMRLDVDEELDGVVIAAPVVGVDPGEEAGGLRRPAPPEVVGQVAQPLHLGRQLDVRDLEGGDLGAGADGLGVPLRPAQGSR